MKSTALKQYALLMTTAAKGAIDSSIEMRRKTNKLNVKGLSTQDVKDEVSKYKSSLDHVHTLVLDEAKRYAKSLLKSDRLGMEDEGSEEMSESPKVQKKRKRPRTDLSQFVSQKTAKRAVAEDDVLELVDQVVEFLNDKYGNDNNSYKKVDTNKATVIKIIRTTDGEDFTHTLIGKYSFDRKREQKPKNGATGEIVSVETEDQGDYTLIKCLNEDKELVTMFKNETIKKGDVLRANAKGGSACPVPSIRGNIIDDMEDVLSRLSKQGVQTMVVKDVEDESSASDNEDADADTDATAGTNVDAEKDEDGDIVMLDAENAEEAEEAEEVENAENADDAEEGEEGESNE